jgi:hypothetical protein
MSICLRAVSLAMCCYLTATFAAAQSVQYLPHDSYQFSTESTAFRGQSPEPVDALGNGVAAETNWLIESELSPADFRPEPLWDKSGWYSSMEIVSVNQSDSMFGIDERWGEIAASPRFTLGWEDEDGVGVRGEVWHYRSQQDANVFANFSDGTSMLVGQQPIEDTASTLELDFYRRYQVDGDEFSVGSGLKAASHSFSVAEIPQGFIMPGIARLEGAGISVFANGRKSFYSTDKLDVAFIAEGRASLLWGDSEFSSEFYADDDYERFGIYDASLGVEWRRRLNNSIMYIRGQYETQLWDLEGDSSVGFTGTSVSMGITW